MCIRDRILSVFHGHHIIVTYSHSLTSNNTSIYTKKPFQTWARLSYNRPTMFKVAKRYCVSHVLSWLRKKKMATFHSREICCFTCNGTGWVRSWPGFHTRNGALMRSSHACHMPYQPQTIPLQKRVLYALQFIAIIWLRKHKFDLYLTVTTCKFSTILETSWFSIVPLESGGFIFFPEVTTE